MYVKLGVSVGNPFLLHRSSGDFFIGTIGNAHTLAIKMFFALSILAVLWSNTKNKTYLILGMVALIGWLFPSAMHTIISAVVVTLCILITVLLRTFFRILLGSKKARSRILFAFLAISVVFCLVAIIQKNNIRYGINRISISLKERGGENSRKLLGFENTIVKLPTEKDYAPIIGVGFGSYSSRAALILSGEYLRQHPSFIPISVSNETEKFIVPLWNRELLKDRTKGGVTNMPFFTWQSIYGELGLIGIVIFSLIFFQNLKVFFPLSKSFNVYLKSVSYALLFFTIYLLFLFVFDNWVEYPTIMIPYWMITGLLLKHQNSGLISGFDRV
jgi:hypothetical protein